MTDPEIRAANAFGSSIQDYFWQFFFSFQDKMSEEGFEPVPTIVGPKDDDDEDVPIPRIGGIQKLGKQKIPWTGGGMFGENKCIAPAFIYRILPAF